MPTRNKTGPITLTLEAQFAVKNNAPTDNRLIEVLNGVATNGAASRPLQRWLAAQVLGQYGYKFEV